MKKFCLFLGVMILSQLSAVENNPVQKVKKWIDEEKLDLENQFHTFVTLATVNEQNHPTTRLVELISFNEMGGLFFTHGKSGKVAHLEKNPNAAMNLWLSSTHRQITMEGKVLPISRQEAEMYWKRMPRNMQLTFLVSNHKGKIDSLDPLRAEKRKLDKEIDGEIPLPDVFVGFRLVPEKITFFDEIHFGDFADKEIAYRDDESWIMQRLQP